MQKDSQKHEDKGCEKSLYKILYCSILLIGVAFQAASLEILSTSILSIAQRLDESLSTLGKIICFKYLGGLIAFAVLLPFSNFREKFYIKDGLLFLASIGSFLVNFFFHQSTSCVKLLAFNLFLQGFFAVVYLYNVNRIAVPLLKSKSLLFFNVQTLAYALGGLISSIITNESKSSNPEYIKNSIVMLHQIFVVDIEKVYKICSYLHLSSSACLLLMGFFNLTGAWDRQTSEYLVTDAQEENEKKISLNSASTDRSQNISPLQRVSNIYDLYRPSFHLVIFIVLFFFIYFLSEEMLTKFYSIYFSQIGLDFSPDDPFLFMIFFWLAMASGRFLACCIVNRDFVRIMTIIFSLILFATTLALNFTGSSSLRFVLISIIVLFLHGFCQLSLLNELAIFSAYNFYYLIIIYLCKDLAGLVQIYPISLIIDSHKINLFFTPMTVFYGVAFVIYYTFLYYSQRSIENL